MRVVIAGGAGFIGSHLCRTLLKDDHEVICIDNLLTGNAANIKPFQSNSKFTFINQNVARQINIDGSVDAIYHLASPASPNHHSPISYHALPLETMEANTMGTFILLKLAKEKNARFLFASSSECYGDPVINPQTEEYRGNVSTTGPRSVYDESKRFGETITAHFWRNAHVNARIARIFNTYGPGMQPIDKRMIISFIMSALKNEPITIFGSGTQTRSLCFIDDLIDGLTRLMNRPHTEKEIVNLGNPHEYTVLQYAQMVKKMLNSKSEIKLTETLPQDDPKKRKPNIEKAKTLLDWEPQITIEQGLEKTIQYFKSL